MFTLPAPYLGHQLSMDTVTIEEGRHTLPDGTELYTKSWKVGFAQLDLTFLSCSQSALLN